MEFKDVLKFYPNFPSEGINFVDIMPFLQDRKVFSNLIAEIGKLVTAPSVAAPEARAFLFSTPLLLTDCGVTNVIPFRKKGKLPHSGDDLQRIEIMKEYGPDRIYFRKSDIAAGESENGVFRITVLDDVLATGGTAEGIAHALGATRIKVRGEEYRIKVAEFIFIAELDGLNGRGRLSQIAPVHTIIHI
jgi:adenine phosphoribosyltransferase